MKNLVSLTCYGQRIETVHMVISSLLNQTKKADKIILWLDKNEFQFDFLPLKLTELCDDEFEIRFCENFKSYKKLIPTLKQFNNCNIITFDDDMLIPSNLLEDMFREHLNNPSDIICSRARIISKKDGKLLEYKNWHVLNNSESVSSKTCLLPLGYGGILYPSGSLYSDVTNDNLFLEFADNADDIWFKCQSLLVGTKVTVLPRICSEKLKAIPNTQDHALFKTVNVGNKNGDVLNGLISLYPKLREIFDSKNFGNIIIPSFYYKELDSTSNSLKSHSFVAGYFRDEAIKVEKDNLNLALDLMKIAKKYRPNGPVINNKISEYSSGVGCEKSPTKVIAMLGCFRSGTNYSKSLLESNYDCIVKNDIFGWKHGFVSLASEQSKNVELRYDGAYFVTKNPFSFVVSLYKYYKEVRLNVIASDDFYSFIRNKIVIFDQSNPDGPKLRFSNPVELWNNLNFNYLSVSSLHHVKYESLLSDTEEQLKIIAQKMGLARKTQEFISPKNSVKRMNDKQVFSDIFQMQTNTPFDVLSYENNSYMNYFHEEDVKFILEHIDSDLIVKLDYKEKISELLGFFHERLS
ncbi:hypothetical protein ACFFLZ_00630 [Photobacterium aphoticum]|uniref:hypothetical protein n=1 Tax=Photobacterium aphoticum TaxID=754436 RepID=UPI0011B1FE3D|nr:hypothetical protein [Photobacterium aphoticum]